jgi:dsDNA-binding SOS-regulon protein
MADDIRATPQNQILGLLSSGLSSFHQGISNPFGYQNPPAEMISNFIGVPALQRTIERMSYGEPLTTGQGMTTQVRPDTLEAALAVAPLAKGVKPVARMAGQEITDVMSGLPARSVLGEMTPQPMQLIGTRFKTGTPTEVPGFGAAKEIPDNYSFFSGEALKDLSQVFGNKNVTLKDILDHPSLYRDYPELAKYPVTGLGLFQNNLKGAYGEGKLYLQRNFNPSTDDIKAAHSTLLHEVQHAIQELDKMPTGGMTEDFLSKGYQKAAGKISLMRDGANKELQNLIKDKGYGTGAYYDILFNNKKGQELVAQDKDLEIAANLTKRLQKSQMKLEDKYNTAFEKYKSYAGETQARAVQQRFLNPQEYRKPVLESYDRPVESLIYRDPFGNTVQ